MLFLKNLFSAVHIISFSFLIILSGCSTCKKTSNEKINLEYEITTGTGGGFTGVYEGFLIDSIGYVKSWNGITADESKKEDKGKLSDEDIISLNKLIKDSGILTIQYRQPGNMNTFLLLKQNENEFRFTWEGASLKENLPEEIKKVYKTIYQMINNLK